MNPKLVGPLVAYRTHATPLALALIGPGIALAPVGDPWIGGLLVTAGVVPRRLVKSQAARVVLHLAARVHSVYEQVTEQAVMQVQRRQL